MNILGVIPARYKSTRFPGKPLALIHGKTMIERVYTQASKTKSLSGVIVATDDNRIFNHVKNFGGEVIMTSETHLSGTDRCAEVISVLDNKPDVVINIQGDEPYIHPEQIDLLASSFKNSKIEIATLVKYIIDPSDLSNSNIVKVVLTNDSRRALYFSRQCIPYCKPQEIDNMVLQKLFFSHIGIYGYTTEVLPKLTKLPTGKLERTEKLEQLRWLENGYSIFTALSDHPNFSIDQPGDINTVESIFSA
jgi:3-deoxy-manno-octulosonate cytidylyltransferase (CMP-KDO synthetase)